MPICCLVREMFCVALCAAPPVAIVIEPDSAVAASASTTRKNPAERIHEHDVIQSLQVQAALRAGRDLVARKDYGDAIAKMEPWITSSDGSDSFLVTLASAYRGRIAQLLSEGKTEEATALALRLRILSGTELGDLVNATVATPAVVEPTDSQSVGGTDADPPTAIASTRVTEPAPAAEKPQSAEPTKETSTPSEGKRKAFGFNLIPSALTRFARVKPLTDSRQKPTEPTESTEPAESKTESADAFARRYAEAEKLYSQERYAEALPLYEQAYEADPVAVQAGRDRWGYCLLVACADRYNAMIASNAKPATMEQWTSLEKDVRLARRLAPSLDFTDKVLACIQDRKQALAGVRSPAMPVASTYPAVSIAPTSIPARSANGWSILQTENFRIYHRDPELAADVAKRAEKARIDGHRLWLPNEPIEKWDPVCELYLYPTAQEYSAATGIGPQSPGQTNVTNDGGRIIRRRIDLRTDDPTMPDAVLPHEITHVVLAGRFGARSVPRWADEGMAVLSEPAAKQNAHLTNLAAIRQRGGCFTCAQIMTMGNYPQGNAMRDFYAHSVGICRYLVEVGGPEKLVHFLRSSLRSNNYEAALREVYGMQSFQHLEAGFDKFLSGLANGSGGVAIR